MTDGIHIPRDVADAQGVPDELDSGIVGEYRFPDPRRRKIAGWMYLGTAVLLAPLAWNQPLAWLGVGLLVALALLHVSAAWPLVIDQEAALATAAAEVPFPIGHASAAVGFVGVRSRPRWHVIVYSADEPPSSRALVQIDAVTGETIGDLYQEPVPPAV